jgi:hypothetical protein
MAMNSLHRLSHLDSKTYVPSPLHGEAMAWVEKNCYVDVFIELIHALGLEPRAALPFVFTLDFLNDQWTFFKPPHHDLQRLYGIDIQELNVWRPLYEHALTYQETGDPISTEADSYWLPDTAGTDYRRNHVKTTIIICHIDAKAQTLGYFHNAGYFQLDGEDFRHLFRLDVNNDPAFMPFYAEIVRLARATKKSQVEITEISLELLRHHLTLVAADNPVSRFETYVIDHCEKTKELGIDYYHAWSFATTRQLGAASELAAVYCEWLTAQGRLDLVSAAADFRTISTLTKTLLLKMARIYTTQKISDLRPLFVDMAEAWSRGIHTLSAAVTRQ